MNQNSQTIDPKTFFQLAIRFEGSLIIVALALAWLVDINLSTDIDFTLSALAWSIAATLPLFLLLHLFYTFPIGVLYQIKRFLIDVLGPCLNVCRLYEIILLALLAGVSEELLFRGVLQPWFEQLWGLIAGIVVTNILFGLAHAITVTYAILAFLIGIYLSALLDIDEQRNLLIPILTHAIYDFLAFIVVLRTYRSENGF